MYSSVRFVWGFDEYYRRNSIYTLMSVSEDLEESDARYELEQLCVTTSPQDPFDYLSLLIMCFVVSRLLYQGMSHSV
jgi:hypothetical protein